MIKNKYVLILVSSLALLTPSLAQIGAPSGGPNNAIGARMQPIFDLIGRVSLLEEMDA